MVVGAPSKQVGQQGVWHRQDCMHGRITGISLYVCHIDMILFQQTGSHLDGPWHRLLTTGRVQAFEWSAASQAMPQLFHVPWWRVSMLLRQGTLHNSPTQGCWAQQPSCSSQCGMHLAGYDSACG